MNLTNACRFTVFHRIRPAAAWRERYGEERRGKESDSATMSMCIRLISTRQHKTTKHANLRARAHTHTHTRTHARTHAHTHREATGGVLPPCRIQHGRQIRQCPPSKLHIQVVAKDVIFHRPAILYRKFENIAVSLCPIIRSDAAVSTGSRSTRSSQYASY